MKHSINQRIINVAKKMNISPFALKIQLMSIYGNPKHIPTIEEQLTELETKYSIARE